MPQVSKGARNVVGRKRRGWRSQVLGASASSLAAAMLLGCAHAQDAPAPGTVEFARVALYGDPEHVNISGMWEPDFGGGFGAPPPYTPEYQALVEEQSALMRAGTPDPDTVARCLAFGMPRFMGMPMEIIQTPGQITLNLGVLHDIRRIYLDGRHTDFADPSFNGDAIGHWEDDTLVAETIKIRAGQLSQFGGLYSDQLTAAEEFRLVDVDTLEHTMTLTDPEAFSEPYVVTRRFNRMPPGSRFEEYICENQRD